MASLQSSALALRARLVLAAFLMLFVELALIRWLGANVLYLAYFSNVVLLGSFLGIGLGFLWTSRSETPLYRFAPLALTTLVVVPREGYPEAGSLAGVVDSKVRRFDVCRSVAAGVTLELSPRTATCGGGTTPVCAS